MALQLRCVFLNSSSVEKCTAGVVQFYCTFYLVKSVRPDHLVAQEIIADWTKDPCKFCLVWYTTERKYIPTNVNMNINCMLIYITGWMALKKQWDMIIIVCCLMDLTQDFNTWHQKGVRPSSKCQSQEKSKGRPYLPNTIHGTQIQYFVKIQANFDMGKTKVKLAKI